MAREAFDKLCDQISGDAVFQNNSTNPQQPVYEQLMVALKQFGYFDNACQMLVTWPSRGARQTLQKYHADSGFEGCVGLIDGTLIPLHKCPQKDGSDYYSRKGFHVIAALVVCDHKKNITYVYTGWPGCSHDQALTRNSILTTNPEGFFSDSEYLLADSAFTPTVNMVPAYKREQNRQLTKDQHNFNQHLSTV
ncbi:hypothetical protein MJO28_013218 [Puccinia striiformis f. sp. tritici]|uniref:Uncharacterized protein n=1 Tax=Puccinia striiformis f. sp. tritici TaxID=168172 RepID=A0ACC0DZ47_9BASI|nr:hypothetical protein MJO28_013218 [Puccinia striiformis f. sp. tritici]